MYFGKIIEHVESQVDVDEFIDAGDQVVAIGHSRSRIKANGRAFEVAIAHVWTVQQGKVLRGEAYIDTPKMLQMLKG